MLCSVLPSVPDFVFLCAETGKSWLFILVSVQQMSLSPVLGEFFRNSQWVDILLLCSIRARTKKCMFFQTLCTYFWYLHVYTQMPGTVLKLAASINESMCYYLLITIMPLMHHKSFHQKIGFVGDNLFKYPMLEETREGSVSVRKRMGEEEQSRSCSPAVGRDAGSACEGSPPLGIALAVFHHTAVPAHWKKKCRVLWVRKVMVCLSRGEEINGNHYKGV